MFETLGLSTLAGLSGFRMLMPWRAFSCAFLSAEKILIVVSIPEAAMVGSYGWPEGRLSVKRLDSAEESQIHLV